ncbi:MAG: DUF2284 domain-containing protein [Eubacteriaceae bacterium]|nr:DUF2284 domain-containing protein [Eubacteriaceae bacterium]
MQEIVEVIKKHISNYSEIPMDSIILRDEVRALCEKNHCGSYGKNWACPPAIASLETIKGTFSKYKNFIVLHEVYQLEDQYDWEGMVESVVDFQNRLLKVKNEIGDQFNSMILGVGGCTLCKECTYSKGEPCRRPNDKIISLEAHGIDVMSLMKDNGLKYNNGPNTVTYIGGVLY